jgi:hypothetical protein
MDALNERRENLLLVMKERPFMTGSSSTTIFSKDCEGRRKIKDD